MIDRSEVKANRIGNVFGPAIDATTIVPPMIHDQIISGDRITRNLSLSRAQNLAPDESNLLPAVIQAE
jgi:hypothetical protein